MTEEQFTILLETMHGLSSHLDEQIASVRADMATTADLAKLEANMATKDFVDRRFNQLEAKIGTLTDTLFMT